MGKPTPTISKRSWPQRIQFWRDPSTNPHDSDEDDDDDDVSTTHSSPSSSSDGGDSDSFSGTYDGVSYADDMATYDDQSEYDEDVDPELALQEFVGGVLSKAKHSFRSFMNTGYAQESLLSDQMDDEDEDEEEDLNLEEDEENDIEEEAPYRDLDQRYSAPLRGAPSFEAERNAKITTTTAEEHLTTNIKLLHEEVEEEEEEELYERQEENAGCVVFPFDFRRKPINTNRSFASTAEESTFLQLQEKLRETRNEKMSLDSGVFARDDEEKTLEEESRNNGDNLRRLVNDTTDQVLDTIGLLGCGHGGAYETKERRSPDEETNTYDASYVDTATDYDSGFETYPDELGTDDEYDTNVEGSTVGDSTHFYGSHRGEPKFTNGMKSFMGQFYGDTANDESSVGSGMDQSHIYLMMTTARRQRTMQERKKQGVQNIDNVHLMSLTRPPNHVVKQSSFLDDVPFIPNFMKQQNGASTLKMQGTRAIQERWIREIQMAIHEPPDSERQAAAEDVLASWKRNHRPSFPIAI